MLRRRKQFCIVVGFLLDMISNFAYEKKDSYLKSSCVNNYDMYLFDLILYFVSMKSDILTHKTWCHDKSKITV